MRSLIDSLRSGDCKSLLACFLYFDTGFTAWVMFGPLAPFVGGKTGLMTGIIGAAGGIGGFYLPVVMGFARESAGSYRLGFATFGVLAALAFLLLLGARHAWLAWALPTELGPRVGGGTIADS